MVKKYVIILILLTLTIACKNRTKEKPKDAAKLIREIEKIRLTDLNGQTISLKQYQGKTIFINFWATWCKPCIKEMPSIIETQNMLQKENIIFLLASNESVEQIEEFSNTNKFKFNYSRFKNK